MTWHVSPEEWLLDFTSVPTTFTAGSTDFNAIGTRP